MIHKTFNDACIQLTSCQFSKTVVYHNEFHSLRFSNRIHSIVATSNVTFIRYFACYMKYKTRKTATHRYTYYETDPDFRELHHFRSGTLNQSVNWNTNSGKYSNDYHWTDAWRWLLFKTNEFDLCAFGDKVALMWITSAIIGH